jgi:hypothetical protein
MGRTHVQWFRLFFWKTSKNTFLFPWGWLPLCVVKWLDRSKRLIGASVKQHIMKYHDSSSCHGVMHCWSSYAVRPQSFRAAGYCSLQNVQGIHAQGTCQVETLDTKKVWLSCSIVPDRALSLLAWARRWKKLWFILSYASDSQIVWRYWVSWTVGAQCASLRWLGAGCALCFSLSGLLCSHWWFVMTITPYTEWFTFAG